MSKLASVSEKFVMGERLLALRKQLRLTQVEFAHRLGLAPRAYANYERGERELPCDGIRRLYHEFNVDPLWLIEGDPQGIQFAAQRVLDKNLMKEVGLLFEKLLDEASATMGPRELIDAALLAYEICADEGKPTPSKLAKVIDYAARKNER